MRAVDVARIDMDVQPVIGHVHRVQADLADFEGTPSIWVRIETGDVRTVVDLSQGVLDATI